MYLVLETLMMTSFYLFGIFYTKYHLSIVNSSLLALECCKEFDQEYHKYMVKHSLELKILMFCTSRK